MSEPERKERKPMWNSRKAWALVLGGMILVGLVNVFIAVRYRPKGFDENWTYADAAVPPAKAALPPDPAPAPTPDEALDAGVATAKRSGTAGEPAPRSARPAATPATPEAAAPRPE